MKILVKKITHLLVFTFLAVLITSPVNARENSFKDPVIGSKGYHVGSYGGGAYWVTDGLYNSLFVVSDKGVIVVDAPPSYADKIPAAIKEVTNLPVKYFVYSHHHGDHTGGSAVFGDNVIRVGHELAAQELRRKNDPNRPVPTVTFSDTYTLTLGNQRVELAYPGLQHSPGNVFIYLPSQKVLMMVDVLYPGSAPFNHFAVAASVPGFYDAFDQAGEYDFKYIQGGHVGRPGTRGDFANIQGYITDVHTNAMMAMQNTSPPIPFSGGKLPITEPYFAINGYIEAASKVCAQLTMKKWRNRLNTVDIFTEGHCWTAVVDLMID